ncbi:MAG: class I SAM-dependent methyltransferase [Sphingomonadales bacterium]|nr:class I SAM-dependent methyltransferase [Sphingomonadales bacterium]
METLKACPACESLNKPVDSQSIVDYSVSKEVFAVVCCGECGLWYTNPRPDQVNIGSYYQSDDYVSHTGADAPGLINAMYRWVRQYTIGVKKKQVERWGGHIQRRLLDVGCGTGEFASHMSSSGWDVLVVEPDPATAERARRLHGLKVNNEEWLKITNDQFGVVTMWHVLEHVHDLRTHVNCLHKLIMPGGLFVVAVPNPMSTDAQHYKQHWAAWDVPRHLYHFRPNMLRKFVEAFGFECLSTRPMIFDPMYVSILSEKYRSGSAASSILGLLKGLWFLCSAKLKKDACSSQVYFFRKRNNS